MDIHGELCQILQKKRCCQCVNPKKVKEMIDSGASNAYNMWHGQHAMHRK